ncbi:MAG: prepilin-type N-terminal cleavage/methylation domain-containing protein [Planctomycetota bacterium]
MAPTSPTPGPAQPRVRRRGGFTLIELLVTIAIIALLIGILLPVLFAVRGAGRSAMCLSNLRSVTQAALVFSADHRDQLPSNRVRSDAVPDISTGATNAHITWRAFLVLKNYLPDGPDASDAGETGSDVWLCPSAPTGALSEQAQFDGFATYCEDDVVSNYAYNGMLAWRYPPPIDPEDIDLIRIKQPSVTFAVGETRAQWPDVRELLIDVWTPPPFVAGTEAGDAAWDGGGVFSWWHAGDAHWAMFDGSVSSMGLLETVQGTPRWRNVPVEAGFYDDWPERVAPKYR